MWVYLHYFEHDGDPDCDSDYWGPFPYLLKHKKWLIDQSTLLVNIVKSVKTISRNSLDDCSLVMVVQWWACSCIVLVCSSTGLEIPAYNAVHHGNELWTSSRVTRIIVIMPPEILCSRANNFITATLFLNITYYYFPVQKWEKVEFTNTILYLFIQKCKGRRFEPIRSNKC